MRVWYLVWAGMLALACGTSADDLFEGPSDSSAGTSGSSGSGGSGATGGTGGTGGSSTSGGAGGDAGSAATGGSAGDAPDGSDPDAAAEDGALGASGGGGRRDGGDSGGGVGIGGPGEVVCGNMACPLNIQQCCLGFPIFGCQTRFPPVCIVSSQLNCDDSLDCDNGQTCCASTGAQGRLTAANCQDSCMSGQVVVCNDSTSCPTGTCRALAGMQHYRTCVQ